MSATAWRQSIWLRRRGAWRRRAAGSRPWPRCTERTAILAKLPADDPRLQGATLYSSLEPCSERRSRPRTCTRLVLDAGIPRVVIAWREPDLFVVGCEGVELLAAAGVEVVEITRSRGRGPRRQRASAALRLIRARHRAAVRRWAAPPLSGVRPTVIQVPQARQSRPVPPRWCTRTMFVVPGTPGGEPAVMIMASPSL
ncbi:hypothetical protein [Streptomyces sp. NPDC088725]|uniref:hypothetical protein n=1 Tax=Streptomyces sp. NPDC088725 TaxID=3365873 RepID=UPI0038180CBB